MHKLVVLYPEPTDRQKFVDYYTKNHLPLAAKLPGLLNWKYSVEVSETDQPILYFAIFEAEFADIEAFKAAMASEVGRGVAEDVPNYATGGAVVMDYAVSGGGSPTCTN